MKTFIYILSFFSFAICLSQTDSKTDYLKAALKNNSSDTSSVKNYEELIKELKSQSPKEALAYAFTGLKLADKIKFYKGQSNLYSLLGPIYTQLGKPDSAEFFLKKALLIAKQNQLLISEVSALKVLSELFRTTGRFDEALKYYDELEIKAKKAGAMDALASSFSERGIIYWRKNDRIKTVSYFQKAIQIFDTLKPKKEYAFALIGVALVYTEMKQAEKAMELYAKIITLHHRIYHDQLKEKDFYGMSATFLSMGSIYVDLNENDSALSCLNKTIDLASKYNFTKILAMAYNKIGVVYFRKNNFALAEKFFLKSLTLYDVLNNKLGKSYVLNDLCSFYEKTGDYNKMEICLSEAIKIMTEKGDVSELKDLYLKTSVLYEKTKDFKKAYKQRIAYEILNQRLYNAENTKVINEMLAKYESDTKQKENLLLQKENDLSLKTIKQQKTQTIFIICGSVLLLLLIFFILRGIKLQRDNYSLKVKEQEVQLVRLNEMKTLADLKTLQARINPHFLYNALNSITSLVHENPEKAEEMTIKLSRLFRYSINTQEANWSSVKEELNIVQTYLDIERVRFGNRIAFNINADESLLNIMIPRFLLQPLVENALKHGLKDINANGNLTVTLTDKKELIEINVYDNGVPFPTDLMAGYGLQSINDKLNLLCGNTWKMNFFNTGGKRICIELPKYSKI